LATYVGWARTYAKKHDWWDVLAGAAIGAGSAYIFTRPFAKKHDLSIAPVSDGHNFGIVASMKF
jgi:membrane-associated phospholipid phosphatase